MCSTKCPKKFDELYGEVCEKLRSLGTSGKVVEDISKQPSDYARIQYILYADQDIVETFLRNVNAQYEPKDEAQASDLLTKACSQNSVTLINRALCYAVSEKSATPIQFNIGNIQDSKNIEEFIKYSPDLENSLISEIFSRRSAILFHNGKFECCIRDSYRALHFGAHKSYEMVLRLSLSFKQLGYFDEAKLVMQHALDVLRCSSLDNEAKCKETLRLVTLIKEIQASTISPTGNKNAKTSKSVKTQIKLFEGPHENIFGISKVLELKFAQDRGRHVVSVSNIPPGSTLIIEEPFVWSISPSEYSKVCQFCVKSVCKDSIPCYQCSTVMFCSEECQQKSIKFHQIECRILKLLDSSEKLGRMGVLCFRTIAQTPIQILLQHHQSLTSSKDATNGIIMGYNVDGKFASNDYSSVFAQTTNAENRSGADLLKRTYAAIYLAICLRFVGYFDEQQQQSEKPSETKLTEVETIVASLLLRHLQSASCNAYGINKTCEENVSLPEMEIKEVGGASYPIISTTNHSCNPNIYRFNIGKTCVVKALRGIGPGEELFDSYGPLFTTTPLRQRRQELENQYKFTCNCDACSQNWPNFEVLRVSQGKNELRCPNPSCENGRLARNKCSSCGKSMDLKKIQKLLKTAEEKYGKAKELVLKRKISGENEEKAISRYILTLEKLICGPCKEMVEAQELLKLYWNIGVQKGLVLY